MEPISEIARERLIYHNKVNLQQEKPIFVVHRFSVYKLKIIKRLYGDDYGELNYLIQDNSASNENCILYVLLWKPNTICKLKFWRSVCMDKELTQYVVQAFLQNYLVKMYGFERM